MVHLMMTTPDSSLVEGQLLLPMMMGDEKNVHTSVGALETMICWLIRACHCVDRCRDDFCHNPSWMKRNVGAMTWQNQGEILLCFRLL